MMLTVVEARNVVTTDVATSVSILSVCIESIFRENTLRSTELHVVWREQSIHVNAPERNKCCFFQSMYTYIISESTNYYLTTYSMTS